MTTLDAAVQSIVERAGALPSGDAEHHVVASVRELQRACAEREGVEGAVHRLMESVRQLQAQHARGRRRQQQHDAPAVERLLESLQEELLPELRRSGLL